MTQREHAVILTEPRLPLSEKRLPGWMVFIFNFIITLLGSEDVRHEGKSACGGF